MKISQQNKKENNFDRLLISFFAYLLTTIGINSFGVL